MEKTTSAFIYSFNPSSFAKNHLFYVELAGEYFGIFDYKVERDFFESLLIMYIEKGVLEVEQNEKTFHVREDEIVLIDCRSPQRYSSKDPITFKWIHIKGNSVFAYSELLNSHFGEQMVIKAPFPFVQELNFLLGLIRTRSSLEHTKSTAIHRLLGILAETGSRQTKSINTTLATAETFLRHNYGNQISIPDVADHVGLSVYYFTHQFKKQYGISPYEFLIAQRISNAKRLLLNSEMSVKDIAAACGYNNPSIFISTFKSRVGSTPSIFRRNILE